MTLITQDNGWKYVHIETPLADEKGYGRSVAFRLYVDRCDVCGKENAPVLAVDTSQEEYGDGLICQDCTIAAFQLFEKEYPGR